MTISIRVVRLWKIVGIATAIMVPGFQARAASRSVCSGSPANLSTLQNLSVSVPDSAACNGSSYGPLTNKSSVTLAGCRGCAYLIELYYTGSGSGQTTNTDSAYAKYTLQDGVFYGKTHSNATRNTNSPCNKPFSISSSNWFEYSLHTMHGQDMIDLYYVTDGAWNTGLSAYLYNVSVLDAYDDAGD